MSLINLEIISPTGVVFEGKCYLVSVPSASGDVGVMYGHESLIASLREGKIDIYDKEEVVLKSLEIKSGFVEISDGENLKILLD